MAFGKGDTACQGEGSCSSVRGGEGGSKETSPNGGGEGTEVEKKKQGEVVYFGR